MVRVFYHGADYDGECSAIIIKYFYEYHNNTLVDAIPFSYGYDIDLDSITSEDIIYLVDININDCDLLFKVATKCKKLVHIDHHKSFQTRNPDFFKKDCKIPFELVFSIENAACYLTYKYFFNETPPLFIKYLDLYDTWRHDFNYDILSFQYGLKLYETSPKEISFLKADPLVDIWSRLFTESSTLEHVITKGKIVWDYMDKVQCEYTRRFSFLTEFEGYKCICINGSMGTSLMFKDVYDSNIHDLMLIFVNCNNKFWKISLYSYHKDIDVGLIAKKYGGGGHIGAGGFVVKHLSDLNCGIM